jgi:hypothetical protein
MHSNEVNKTAKIAWQRIKNIISFELLVLNVDDMTHHSYQQSDSPCMRLC